MDGVKDPLEETLGMVIGQIERYPDWLTQMVMESFARTAATYWRNHELRTYGGMVDGEGELDEAVCHVRAMTPADAVKSVLIHAVLTLKAGGAFFVQDVEDVWSAVTQMTIEYIESLGGLCTSIEREMKRRESLAEQRNAALEAGWAEEERRDGCWS
jgi:hypothetical protein